MIIEQLFTLLIIVIHLNGLRSNDLKKTEAVDFIPNNKETFEDYSLSCDLTKNYCDINCCNDKDCSDAERSSFDCSQKTNLEETSLFSSHICNQVSSQDLEARALLCLQHANSPYLGEFYIEDKPFSNDEIKQVVQSRKKHVTGFIKQSTNIVNYTFSNYYYHYGYRIKKYEGKRKTSNIYLPLNIIKQTGFCVERPLRFMVNSKSNCLHTLSTEACLTTAVFRLNNFISAKSKVISGRDEKIKINPEVHCLKNGTKYITFSRNIFNRIFSTENTNTEKTECIGDDYLIRLNRETGICENVIVSLDYIFYHNKTNITGVSAKVLLADIPLSIDSFLELIKGRYKIMKHTEKDNKLYMYLSQSFSVVFIDENNTKEIKKQGYKLHDLLFVESNYSSLT